MVAPTSRWWSASLAGLVAVAGGILLLALWIPPWRRAVGFRIDLLAPEGGSARAAGSETVLWPWPRRILRGLEIRAPQWGVSLPEAWVEFPGAWRPGPSARLKAQGGVVTWSTPFPLAGLLRSPPTLPLPFSLSAARLKLGAKEEPPAAGLDLVMAGPGDPFHLRWETPSATLAAKIDPPASDGGRTLRLEIDGEGWSADLKARTAFGPGSPTFVAWLEARGPAWSARGAIDGELPLEEGHPRVRAVARGIDVELPLLGSIEGASGPLRFDDDGIVFDRWVGRNRSGEVRFAGGARWSPPRFEGNLEAAGIDLEGGGTQALAGAWPAGSPWEGSLGIAIENLRIPGGRLVHRVHGSLEASSAEVALRGVEWNLADGTWKGGLRISRGGLRSSWAAALEAHEARIERLLEGTIEGVLSMGGYVAGRSEGGEVAWGALNGRGNLSVVRGRLDRLSLPNAIAEAGAIDGWPPGGTRGTDFSSLEGSFTIEGGDLLWKELVLQGADYLVEGEGSVHLPEGSVRLRGEAVLSPPLSKTLASASLKGWKDGDESIHVPLLLTGRASSIDVGLDRLALASQIREASRQQVLEELNRTLARRFGGEEPRPSAAGDWMERRMEEFFHGVP